MTRPSQNFWQCQLSMRPLWIQALFKLIGIALLQSQLLNYLSLNIEPQFRMQLPWMLLIFEPAFWLRCDVIDATVAIVFINDVIPFKVDITFATNVNIFFIRLAKKRGNIGPVFGWIRYWPRYCTARDGAKIISLETLRRKQYNLTSPTFSCYLKRYRYGKRWQSNVIHDLHHKSAETYGLLWWASSSTHPYEDLLLID